METNQIKDQDLKIGESAWRKILQKTINLLITLVNADGAGTVTSVSVATANGYKGTVATANTTPVITIDSIAKVYKAHLTQAGTSAPTVTSNGSGAATPFINTLGVTISYSYVSVGIYRATASAPIFTSDAKTLLMIGNGNITGAGGGNYNQWIPEAYWVSTTVIEIYVGNAFTGGDLTNDGLYSSFFVIEVYP